MLVFDKGAVCSACGAAVPWVNSLYCTPELHSSERGRLFCHGYVQIIRKSFPVTYPVSVSMFDPRSKMIILSSNLESMDSNRSCRVSNRLGPASWMKNPAPWTSSGSVHPMRSNECETCLVRGAAFSLDHLTCRVVQTQRWSKHVETQWKPEGFRRAWGFHSWPAGHSCSALRCGCGKMGAGCGLVMSWVLGAFEESCENWVAFLKPLQLSTSFTVYI